MAKISKTIECMWCKEPFSWDWIVQNDYNDAIWDVEKIDDSFVHAKLIKQEQDRDNDELQFLVICPHCHKDQLSYSQNPITGRKYVY